MATKFRSAAKKARESSSASAASSSPAPSSGGDGTPKMKKFVDAKVAARNNALNAMGGVKVDVFVRVRPRLDMESGHPIVVTIDEADIVLEDPMGRPAKYTYDKVYGPEATQEMLYEDAVAPIVDQVARGLSCAIFAYGQTGTGKTYTMRGSLGDDSSQHGVIQRSVDNLFVKLTEHEYTDISVGVSFLEIYNEELEDLLTDAPKIDPLKKSKKKTGPPRLMLTDDDKRGTVCQGLAEVPVDSAEQVMALLREADKRCKVSETKMNKMSNRAHRIFTIIAKFKRYESDVTSTLTFVDLAGSEDILKSGATGLTAREASHINKSLLTLGRVINALACNEKHIPYRDSKLTRLLSEALGGVCKTSFIACISPCNSSLTETNSTLRYAERAMEALNISQLPRWKQDEIMIDGLTRRVQNLVDQLAAQDKMHREEMSEVMAQKAELVAMNNELRIRQYHDMRKIQKLEARKLVLKQGLALMTSNRDTLQQQKEALRAELVLTRQQRDGFLHDRKTLDTVLAQVRTMRDRLLVAHADTESSLTADAQELKRVIEGAIKDIGDLHTEVARKKKLSVHNENAADEFRDNMSGKLRAIVSAVADFRAQQGSSHDGLHAVLSSMRNNRQRETSALRQDMAKLSTKATDILAGINQQSAEFETQQKVRINKGRDEAENHRDDVTVAVDKFRTAVTSRIDDLRSHAKNLEDQMQAWTDKVEAKIAENTASANGFASNVMQQLAAMQAHLESASNEQLNHLKQHHGNLQKHLDTEHATMNSETEKLIDNLNSYIGRMLTDFKKAALDRTDHAVAGFHQEVDALCGETRDMVSHQVAEFGSLNSKTNDWNGAITRSFQEGQANNAAAHNGCVGMLQSTLQSAREAETEMAVGADNVENLSQQYFQCAVAHAKEATSAAEYARSTYDRLTTDGTSHLQTDAENVRERVQGYADVFAKEDAQMKGSLDSTMEHVKSHSTARTDDLNAAETDTVTYVMQTIKRDTQAPPPHKNYVYPTNYKATDEYAAVLKDTPEPWTREAQLRAGELTPGKPVDYPGEMGPADHSGLYTTTATKDPAPEDAELADDAAHQSEAEDYETDRDGLTEDEDDEDDEDEGEDEDGNAADTDAAAAAGDDAAAKPPSPAKTNKTPKSAAARSSAAAAKPTPSRGTPTTTRKAAGGSSTPTTARKTAGGSSTPTTARKTAAARGGKTPAK